MTRQVTILAGFAISALAGYLWAIERQALAAVFAAMVVIAFGYMMRERAPSRIVVTPAPPPPVPTAPTITLSSLESAAVLVDRHYGIIAMNAEAIDAFGAHTPGEDIRVAIRHPAVIECVTTAMLQNRDSVREIEGLGRHSAVFRLRAAPAGAERLLLLFADVSPARLAERMRADFVANASHELRTPLATLVGFIETLQGSAASDEAARTRFLGVMENEAARMTRLIDDLLSLSRIELDKNIRPREIIDIPPLIDNLVTTTTGAFEADGRQLVLNVASGLPKVIADHDQILQVLHNLVSNAIKYGRSGTPVTLKVERARSIAGDVVRMAVEDIGDGIAPEHIPRLTERFYRVDTGRSRRLGGTGLGLAIVKHIVERHRGILEIQSEVGKGTVVSFMLPSALSQN